MVSGVLRLTGTLLEHAYTRVTPDGAARVCVQIEQEGGGLPVHADHLLGQGNAAQQVAARVAGYLRRGTPVTVRAKSITVGRKPREHLRLVDVLGVEYPTPKPRHEPQEQESA
jgi:hypothetical protein